MAGCTASGLTFLWMQWSFDLGNHDMCSALSTCKLFLQSGGMKGLPQISSRHHFAKARCVSWPKKPFPIVLNLRLFYMSQAQMRCHISFHLRDSNIIPVQNPCYFCQHKLCSDQPCYCHCVPFFSHPTHSEAKHVCASWVLSSTTDWVSYRTEAAALSFLLDDWTSWSKGEYSFSESEWAITWRAWSMLNSPIAITSILSFYSLTANKYLLDFGSGFKL